MLRLLLRKTCFIAVAVVGATLTTASGTAVAQIRPFAIAGVGTAPEGLPLPPPFVEAPEARPHNILGVATQLGLHTGAGTVQTNNITGIDPNTGVISGEFQGKFTFVSAAGKLVCNYGNTAAGANTAGTYTISPVTATTVDSFFIAEFVVDPVASTGKFKGVTGSWVMYAQTAPFVLGSSDPINYGWVGAGFLKFPKK